MDYYCWVEKKPCDVQWVKNYFGDCLCNFNDRLSLTFGVISLFCWAIAEIPQIITNFRSKTSHGISFLFLITWIAGDIFNVVGCLLEPAVLPTQYYTALLYTASTMILVSQSLLYDFFYPWCQSQDQKNIGYHQIIEEEEGEEKIQKTQMENVDSGIPIPLSIPIKAPYYYASARSMASGTTPPILSFIREAASGPPAMSFRRENYCSSSDEGEHEHNRPVRKSRSKSITSPSAIILASSLGLLPGGHAYGVATKLLRDNGYNYDYGQLLGWMMATVYMGSRIPQIWLNIKRGSVEGLNPLMFIFAIVANATYVASILLRSMEWEKIKGNLPWLLDAAVCVGLDLFIILQFIYYNNRSRRRNSRWVLGDRHEDPTTTTKPLLC